MKYLSIVACLILSLHAGAQKVEILRTSDLDPHKNANIGSLDMLDPSAVDSGTIKYMDASDKDADAQKMGYPRSLPVVSAIADEGDLKI
jgi:hypothetical protein